MTPPPLHIREACRDDAEAIAGLVSDLGYPTTGAQMRERLAPLLAAPMNVTFVADIGGRVVGVAGASLDRYYERDGLYARLLVLAVSAPHRGLGAGRQLVAAVERWAAAGGGRELFVNSGLHRSLAHVFYERSGFTRSGFRFVKPLTQRD